MRDRWKRRRDEHGVDIDPAQALARQGLVDLTYYRGQLGDAGGRLTTVDDVVRYHIERGRSDGLTLHPLIEPEWWRGDVGVDPIPLRAAEQELADGSLSGSTTSPLIADPAVPHSGPSRDLVSGALAGTIPVLLPGGGDLADSVRRLTGLVDRAVRESPNRGDRSAVDWAAAQDAVDRRLRGRVSVLVPTYEDWRMTVDAVRSALAHADGADVEVLIIDNGSRPCVFRLLLAIFLDEHRVRVIRCDRNTNFAGGMNRGIAESTGEYVALLNNDALVTEGWLAPLLRELGSSEEVRGVQPLLLYPGTNRVQAAGTVFLGEGVLPWHFLAGHPRQDALRMTDVRFAAITAAVMVLRARDIVAVEGFDEGYVNGYEDVDLCLRLRDRAGGHFRVVTESVAVHPEGSSPGRAAHDSANRVRFFDRWNGSMPSADSAHYEDIGQVLVGLRPLWYSDDARVTITDPHIVRPHRAVFDGPAAGRACLRWALFDRDVAPAVLKQLVDVLHVLGQEAVTFSGGVHASDALDDVVVTFGSAVGPVPRAGAFNVLVGAGDEHGWDAVLPNSATDAEIVPHLLAILIAAEEHRSTVFGAR